MPAVLCLHGFSGGPFELQPLADALTGGGWRVVAPTLAGHGAGTRELAASSWCDWQRSAEDALHSLASQTGGPVAIVGGSMGGLLALRLARLHPSLVAGLVLLAPPLRLRPVEQKGIGALTSLGKFLGLGEGASIPRPPGADISDAELGRELHYGSEYPLNGLRNLIELQKAVAADLGLVIAPALIVTGRKDHTVPLEVSDEIAERLGSPRIERLMLEESGHLVALDVDRDFLAAEVRRFLMALPCPA